MITFHKDQFGVHVFYKGMNKGSRNDEDLKINKTVEFDPSDNCVVPPVKSVSKLVTETQTTGYKHNETGETLQGHKYKAKLSQLQTARDNAASVEDEVRTEIELRNWKNDWTKQTQEVEKHIECEFEVIDIDYPADERLIPLRHFDNQRVNYFEVYGKKVALAMMRKLCVDAGLKEADRYTNTGRTFSIEDNYSIRWRIEGDSFEDCVGNINLKEFTGHLQECREHINAIECAVRSGFDKWVISGRTAQGLTVKYVTKALDTLEQSVRRIDSKIKTKSSHSSALAHIERIRNEILAMGIQELIAEEENSSDELDNALL